ncbi:type II secretion protein F [Paenibacillus durus]|uniref:Type II secretion protein F n=2 Tax=Paenibacillus durus TaxID=44251 RepID=A0A089HIE3_PAEDU|nr:type II secretion system F family protein [Paenibacillus durus]AIQ11746.1 type II secretion protein F [Paenibacillus durus]
MGNLRWICGLAAIALIMGWVALRARSGKRYAALRSMPVDGLRLRSLSEPLLMLLEKGGATRKFPVFAFRLQRSVQRIYGQRHSAEITLLYMGEMLAYSWLLLLGGCGLAALSGEPSALILGIMLAILLPAALAADLHKKVKVREQLIMMELPDLLSGIVLLVSAGETVQRAITRCLESRKNDSHPLYRELLTMTGEWESGYSLQQAFENFSKRCAVQEVSLFTTTVLLNVRRGGGDFALALRDLSRQLWEKRKAVSRTRGEQASSKLVFPMVVIFVIVIVLVGTPAFMMMNM